MNTDAIESMVRDVLSRMNSLQGESATPPAASSSAHTAKVTDYPLANKHPVQEYAGTTSAPAHARFPAASPLPATVR